jgi:hypothetical protein
MIKIHPTKVWDFLSFRRLIVSRNLRRLFYVSWEDALWDLLLCFQIPKKSICLVPEFFCMDVVKNMEEHGLQPIFYPVDSQLQTDTHVFSSVLKQHQPKVVVILHAAGITNRLFSNNTWLRHLPKNTLLIEDCVHRLIDPQQINLLSPRHFVIDSLRKVAPLYGSNLYGDATTLRNFKQSTWWLTLPYQLQVFWWWLLFQISLHLGWNSPAHRLMKKGYDLIGDSNRAAPGPWVFNFLSQYLDIVKVEKVKTHQVACYQELLKSCRTYSNLYQIHFDQADAGKLRGFPIGIVNKNPEQFLQKLQESQLAWKYELDDCPWSKRQKIIYLPLGPHLTTHNIETICERLFLVLS